MRSEVFLSILLASGLASRLAAARDSVREAPTAAHLQAGTDQPASAGSTASPPPDAAPAPAPAAPAPAAPSYDAPPAGFSSAPPLQPAPLGVDTSESFEPTRHSKTGHVSGFMGWAFNVPLGSVRDFTAVVSPLGFEVQLLAWVNNQIALGIDGDWATYVDNRPRTTYDVSNGAVTATAYNYTQTSSVRFLANYFLMDEGPVLPYIGLHAGVSWATFESQMADLTLSDTEFSFSWGGQAGIQVPMGRYAPIALVNLRYVNTPAQEFLGQVSNVQSLGLLLGIGF
jgi:hypothetical protein